MDRPADTVARLGGDEFALLLEELASADEALAVAERALDAVAAPFELASQPVRASISIGVALRSASGATADELVEEAGAAMYEAKRAGKGRAVGFYPGLRRPPGTAQAPEAIGADSPESAGQAPVDSGVDTPGGGNSYSPTAVLRPVVLRPAVLRPRDLTNKESPERGRIGPDGCGKLRSAGIQAPI